MKLEEPEKVQFTLMAVFATLLAIMITIMLIYPNPHPGKLPPGGEQFPMPNPAS